MRTFNRIALSLCLGIFSSLALAHEGHQEPAPATPAAQPASGTRDAKTWFTDTPLQDQNGQTLRFYSDALQNRVVLLNYDPQNNQACDNIASVTINGKTRLITLK